jgi:hypothetical protein
MFFAPGMATKRALELCYELLELTSLESYEPFAPLRSSDGPVRASV